jgi:hypothetical protein
MYALSHSWRSINTNLFGGRMRPPVLDLHEGGNLGMFQPGRRVISLQREFLLSSSWSVVLEVLKHEMAHQFVYESLGVLDETAHGPTFRRVCRDRGIDARAAGLPEDVDPREQNLVRKVKALLALAKSDNPHEAESAAKAARRLLAEHDLDLGAVEVEYTFRQLQPTKSRFDPWEKALAGLLSVHFGVSTVYIYAFRASEGKWARALEIMGPNPHVEVAAYVHDVLRTTVDRLWRAHKKKRGITSDRDRRTFLYGAVSGFRETLDKEVKQDPTALVKVDDPRMKAYVNSRYPRLISGSGYSIRRGEALEHGREAGREITIRPGVSTGDGGPRQITQR